MRDMLYSHWGGGGVNLKHEILSAVVQGKFKITASQGLESVSLGATVHKTAGSTAVQWRINVNETPISNICLLFMQLAKNIYIHLFKKEGETRSWIKLRFSVSKRWRRWKWWRACRGGSWWGGVSMVSGCRKAFGLSAVQHTRWFLFIRSSCDGSGGVCRSAQLPCLNFFILNDKSETDVSFMRTESLWRHCFTITVEYLVVCFQLLVLKFS